MIRMIAFLSLLFLGCGSCYAGQVSCQVDEQADERRHKLTATPSIFAVLANPRYYHGKRISIVGIFRLYYDRIEIYPTPAHYDLGEVTSVVHADIPGCADVGTLNKMSMWEGKFVQIIGTFDAEDTKTFGVGTITKVERIQSVE